MSASNNMYTFSKRGKNITYALLGVGIVSTVIGFFTGCNDSEVQNTRLWANLLVNGFFFFAIGLGALFFLALQYATEAGWGTVLKRVFEAVAMFLPIGAVVLIIVFAAGTFHVHGLYHWMHEGVMDPSSHHYDEIIAGKGAYLNQPFFWVRTLVYIGTYLIFLYAFKKRSKQEDIEGGTKIHFINYKRGALFLVFFAVFSSTQAWDWIMSLDTHWYSTLFGWYTFAGMWVSSIIVFIMITLYLKSKSMLENVNESHLHDLGKWMFAISFLWSYLFFFQYMLIWYANIPEEVTYYQFRYENYKSIYWIMFIINFTLPMVILMSRDAKRNPKILIGIGSIIFIGHWLDVFVMVMPATMFENWQFGALEIGMFLAFLGLFLHVVLRALSKSPLSVKNHPYLEESIHHNT
jgi:hypothetical protein